MRGELRVAVRAATTPSWRRSAASGGASASWPTLDPQFQPYLDARDGIKSQLEDLALLPAPLRRRHRGVAGAAAAGRGSAGAARAAEAEVRPDAGRRRRAPRRAAARAVRPRRRATSGSPSSSASAADAARRVPAGAPATLSPARRRSRAATSRRSSRRCSRELAMERTRFEVRFGDGRCPRAAWTARGIDAAEFFVSPNLGRGPPAARAHRLRRRAVARHAGAQDADGDVAPRLQRRDRPAAERVGARA